MSDIATGPSATITITLDVSGKVRVNFPANKMLCNHMLHEAQSEIDRWSAGQPEAKPAEAPRVQLVGAGAMR